MTGLDASIRDVRRGLPPLDPDEVLARAGWTLLAEPGDRAAGGLVATVGAVPALDLVRSADPPGAGPGAAELRRALERWRPRLEAGRTGVAVRNAAVNGARLVVPGDPQWPTGLGDLGDHAPIALWLLGDAELLPAASIALVGARAASDYGVGVAVDLAAGVVERGLVVVSGAAYGIDAAAHRSALASGGRTVAVLAGGLDRLYPAGHRDLLKGIADRGAVLSEAPYGIAPARWRFLHRNRLIAAMTRATVVVEAGRRSGALNTAAHAAELGRPLGAVPGSVRSAASAGCHLMLREYDAVCVRDAADAVELVDPAAGLAAEDREPPRSADERRVLDALGRAARSVDEVARRAELDVGRAISALGLLELDGAVRQEAGGWLLG